MNELSNDVKEQKAPDSSLPLDEMTRRVMAAGVGARDVMVLADLDDGEIRYAVEDPDNPGGGYFDTFRLVTGRSYLLIPLEEKPAGIRSGLFTASPDGKG